MSASNLGGTTDVATSRGSGAAALGSASSFVEFQPVDATEVQQMLNDACGGWTTECEFTPRQLVWVIDLSDDLARELRVGWRNWDAIRTELSGVGTTFEKIRVPMSWYLSFFPNMLVSTASGATTQVPCIDTKNDTWLRVDPTSAPSAQKDWQTAIDQVSPLLGTGAPILDAYRNAVALLDKLTDGPPVIVLVTNGRATVGGGCQLGQKPSASNFEPVIAEIEKLRVERGVSTLVVGGFGSDVTGPEGPDMRAALSGAAIAGGLATHFDCAPDGPVYCHVDLTRGDPLTDAIAHLGGCNMGNCAIHLPIEEDATWYSQAVVVRNEAGRAFQVGANDSPNCQVGYHLTADRTTYELCPETCAKASLVSSNTGPTWIFSCGGPSIQ